MPVSTPQRDGSRAAAAAPAPPPTLTPQDGATEATQTPAAPAPGASAPTFLPSGVTRVGFAPIVRVDAPRREVELCATSEAVDSFGTIFDYAASKDAFQRWIGNVREMHERRAVGSRVAVRFDDPARRVYVTVRVSTGAQDTWEKILDGTLRGASIGASNVSWERQVRRIGGRSRALDVATHYDLVELSLVDNPSNPDALGISIVRDAVPNLAMLAPLDYSPAPSAPTSATSGVEQDTGGQPAAASPPGIAPDHDTGANPDTAFQSDADPRGAAGAHLTATSAADVPAAHVPLAGDMAEALPHASSLDAPGIELRARGPFSDNPGGYPDAGVPSRAEERPTASQGMRPEGNLRQRLHAAAVSLLRGCGCPLCQGAIAALDADPDETDIAASMAGRSGDRASATAMRDAALARALAAGLTASAGRLDRMDEAVRGLKTILQTGVSQMAGTVGDLRLRIEALEAQPMPGGPAARAVAVEKTHALAPSLPSLPPDAAEQYRALESLAGRLTDPQAQIAVAAEMIRLRRS